MLYMFEDGTPSPYPTSREQAIKDGKPKWMERGKCEKCGCNKSFYTTTGKCSYCTMITMERVRHVKMHGADTPYGKYTAAPYKCADDPLDDREEVLRLAKIPGHVGDKPCKHGHVKILNQAGKCVQCVEMRRARTEAKENGERWYTPPTPCKKCMGFHLRCVHTGRCQGCNPLKEPKEIDNSTGRLMSENPDMIISKEDAQQFGFTVFRTGQPCKRGHNGWRWVANGACLECMKENRTK